jgi:hypothetical protein
MAQHNHFHRPSFGPMGPPPKVVDVLQELPYSRADVEVVADAEELEALQQAALDAALQVCVVGGLQSLAPCHGRSARLLLTCACRVPSSL